MFCPLLYISDLFLSHQTWIHWPSNEYYWVISWNIDLWFNCIAVHSYWQELCTSSIRRRKWVCAPNIYCNYVNSDIQLQYLRFVTLICSFCAENYHLVFPNQLLQSNGDFRLKIYFCCAPFHILGYIQFPLTQPN